MKTKSALPWFGSDSEVASRLASMLDVCQHVTIPFCGGLAILPHLKARAIVANDKHELAINFYRTASGAKGDLCQKRLIDLCQSTLSHPSEMNVAQGILLQEKDTVEAAWAFWTVCWLGRKGKGGTRNQDGRPSIRRTPSGGTNASRIVAAANDLLEWADEFRRCEWECRDFRDVLRDVADRPDCGIYVDAPWDGPGDGYLHPFTTQDHVDLRDLLSRFRQSCVVVRYGDTPLIRELYSGTTWSIVEADSRDQCNAVKDEVWITRRAL